MLAFVPVGLAPWEVVVFSALCAWTALCIGTAVGATVAYLVTREPRAHVPAVPVYAPQPTTAPSIAMAPAAT